MKRVKWLSVLLLLAGAFCLAGCLNEDNEEDGVKITGHKEYVMTVASKKLAYAIFSGRDSFTEAYAVKKEGSQTWEPLMYISDFDYEEGYEYELRVSETSYYDERRSEPSWTEYKMLELVNKTEKQSEGLPGSFIDERCYNPVEVRYAVEADNKAVIENDIRNNRSIPFGCSYVFAYDNANWLLADANNDVRAYGSVSRKNVDSSEFPESYKLLPPDGQVVSSMEWTFYCILNDAKTEYHSYDVFMVERKDDKNTSAPAMNDKNYMTSAGTNVHPWLYEDLTEYYKTKYPDAGVKTVVVCHTF